MYKCRECGKSSERGATMLKKTIYRVDGRGHKSIHQEIPLCTVCHAKILATDIISPAVSPKYISPKIGDSMMKGV